MNLRKASYRENKLRDGINDSPIRKSESKNILLNLFVNLIILIYHMERMRGITKRNDSWRLVDMIR